MKICIIGGHGKVALLLHPLLVEGGHEVSALIRNQDHAEEVDETGAQSVVADVETMDTEALAAQFAGFDAVIWSAAPAAATRIAPTPSTVTRPSAPSTPPSRPRCPAS